MGNDHVSLLIFIVTYRFLRTPDLSWATSEGIMLSHSFVAVLTVVSTFFTPSAAHKIPSYNASQLVESQTLDSPTPYDFPLLQNGAMAYSGQFPMPMCHGFTLEEATIDQLQQYLSTGNLTSVQLALCYLKRIYQTDEYIRSVYLNNQKSHC